MATPSLELQSAVQLLPNAFPLAIRLLEERLAESALLRSDIEAIARQILARPFDPNSNLDREIKKRITTWQKSSGYSHLRPRRAGRGKLILPGTFASPSSMESVGNEQCDEDLLTKMILQEQSSIKREQDYLRGVVEHARESASPAIRSTLMDILKKIEAGDSMADLAVKTNKHRVQIMRVFQHVQQDMKTPLPIRHHQTVRQTRGFTKYNPPGVPMDVYMMTHQGAMRTYFDWPPRSRWAAEEENPGLDSTIAGRPKIIRIAQHPRFGQVTILSERQLDFGFCFDVELANGTRKTVLEESLAAL